jgi:L-ribulokinase
MFALGVDYGTNSVRALIVRCADGAEMGSCLVDRPSGDQGVLLDPDDHQLARQNPGNYLFGLERSVAEALGMARKRSDFAVKLIVGVGVDSTVSSPGESLQVNGAVWRTIASR